MGPREENGRKPEDLCLEASASGTASGERPKQDAWTAPLAPKQEASPKGVLWKPGRSKGCGKEAIAQGQPRLFGVP